MYKFFEKEVAKKYPQLSLEKDATGYVDSMVRALYEGFSIKGAMVAGLVEPGLSTAAFRLSTYNDKLEAAIVKIAVKVIEISAGVSDMDALVEILDKDVPKALLEKAIATVDLPPRKCDCINCRVEAAKAAAPEEGSPEAVFKTLESIFSGLDSADIHVIQLRKV